MEKCIHYLMQPLSSQSTRALSRHYAAGEKKKLFNDHNFR